MLEEILCIVSWAVQLLLASVAPLGALIALDSALNTQDTPVNQLLGYVFLALLGAGLGLVVSVLIPASLRLGVWVWTMPVIIEVWFIISNLEQLLVFSSHVVASSPEAAKRRTIHQLLAHPQCNQTLSEVYFMWGKYLVSDA